MLSVQNIVDSNYKLV